MKPFRSALTFPTESRPSKFAVQRQYSPFRHWAATYKSYGGTGRRTKRTAAHDSLTNSQLERARRMPDEEFCVC